MDTTATWRTIASFAEGKEGIVMAMGCFSAMSVLKSIAIGTGIMKKVMVFCR
jgi:hypothetical protein